MMHAGFFINMWNNRMYEFGKVLENKRYKSESCCHLAKMLFVAKFHYERAKLAVLDYQYHQSIGQTSTLFGSGPDLLKVRVHNAKEGYEEALEKFERANGKL